MNEDRAPALTLGWREWLSLPDLGVAQIKAKVDTGARTSALHTFVLEELERDGRLWVRFGLHALQHRTDVEQYCEALVEDRRSVTDSGGHQEMRYVIATTLQIKDHRWPIEITLTNRDDMRFRMLLGRTAIRSRAVVDPGRSYVTRRKKKKKEGPSSGTGQGERK